MRCSKEMVDCFYYKVFEMETDIAHIFLAFVLSSTSITKTLQLSHKGKLFFDVRRSFMYKCVNCEVSYFISLLDLLYATCGCSVACELYVIMIPEFVKSAHPNAYTKSFYIM